jgi:hypothetical protein
MDNLAAFSTKRCNPNELQFIRSLHFIALPAFIFGYKDRMLFYSYKDQFGSSWNAHAAVLPQGGQVNVTIRNSHEGIGTIPSRTLGRIENDPIETKSESCARRRVL